jgi:hypothetical protein
MQSVQLASLDVDELRTRLRKMSDEELRKFGEAAKYMVSPRANMGKPPRPQNGSRFLRLVIAAVTARKSARTVELVFVRTCWSSVPVNMRVHSEQVAN